MPYINRTDRMDSLYGTFTEYQIDIIAGALRQYTPANDAAHSERGDILRFIHDARDKHAREEYADDDIPE